MKLSSIGYLFKEGIKNIWNNRMMSLASIIVLVSCLIITGAAMLISVNVSNLIANIGDDNQINVYLDYSLSDLDSIKLGSQISKIPNVEDCEFYSKDEGIKEFEEKLGDDIYHSMQGDDNYFVGIVGFWIVTILGVVTLFIISNTIKMTMYSRRFEISIMKSVGATNAFVRIPFIIEAMTIGFLSGLLSSGVIIFLYEPVRETAAGMISLIGTSTIPVEKLWLQILLCFCGIGIVIGFLGGFISITKYLRKEGGEILGW